MHRGHFTGLNDVINNELILAAVSERIVYYDKNMKILWANKAASEIAGLSLEQLIGKHCYEVWLKAGTKPCPNCPVAQTLRTGESHKDEVVDPEGRAWFIRSYPINGQDGNIIGAVEVTEDITVRKKTGEALAWEMKVNYAIAELASKLIASSPLADISAMVLEQSQQLTGSAFGFVGFINPQTGDLHVPDFSNEIWSKCRVRDKGVVFYKPGGLLGWVLNNRRPLLTNAPQQDVRSQGTPTGHIPIRRFLAVPVLIEDTLVGMVALANSSRDYTERELGLMERMANIYAIAIQRKHAEDELQKTKDELETKVVERTNKLYLVNQRLRSELEARKRMENQLHYFSTHDVLTSVPNRYSLEENLRRAVAMAKRGKYSALILLDLDNFKIVNEIMGHTAGDEILITLSGVLKSNLREGDVLYRLSGDEFAVVLEGTTMADAAVLAEKLRRVVDKNKLCLTTVQQTCFNLTASVGYVMVDGTLDHNKLIVYAYSALYQAKEGGKNRVVQIKTDEDITAHVSHTNEMIGLIKNALKRNLFELHFQPVADMKSGQVAHYETLLRLRLKNGKLIMPGSFIQAAERFGLMPQLDQWVVKSTLEIMSNHAELNTFINLSGTSLGDENLLDTIEYDIRHSAVEPARIGFEITETSAVKDVKLAERWIRRIKNLGCTFALDDFGIGFSSFSYLRMLAVDYLKIDGSFVRNVAQDPTNWALVESMNSIAHTLGKKTIAEFVENHDTSIALKTMGIDLGQGFYFGRPRPLDLTPRVG